MRSLATAWWVALAVVSLGAEATAQCEKQPDQTLLLSPESGEFGQSTAMDGEWAAAGAPHFGERRHGRVWILHHDGTQWTEHDVLEGSEEWGEFGHAVAWSSPWLFVGAPLPVTDHRRGPGRVVAYRMEEGALVERQTLQLGDDLDHFGESLAVEGGLLAVGAPGPGTVWDGAGRVAVFRLAGREWTEVDQLEPPDGLPQSGFGTTVSVADDWVFAGTPYRHEPYAYAGKVDVFRRLAPRDTFVHAQALLPSGHRRYDQFGIAMDAEGPRVLIGSRREWIDRDLAGAVFEFEFDGTAWAETQEIVEPERAAYQQFGHAVCLDGDRAVFGAPGTLTVDHGRAYEYRRNGDGWFPVRRLEAPRESNLDDVGVSVALDGDLALLGAPGVQAHTGSAYAYDLSTWTLDVDLEAPTSGDLLTFTTCGGVAGTMGLTAIVSLDGSTKFVPLGAGRFDEHFQWSTTFRVPAALSGRQIEVQTFAIAPLQQGRSQMSNRVLVTVQ